MTLAFTGDLLPHLPLVAVARGYGADHGDRYDFKPMLAPMRPIIETADLAICHLEVPAAADQDRLSGYPSFGAPVELIDAVKVTGYDGCSTASNHSLDQGRAGIARTLDRFDLDGLRHAGTARTAEEGAATTLYDVGGAKVAHLSYAYGFNGYPLPSDAPFAANQIDVNRIHADATRARQAGAQLVVVSLHWGTEYRHDPDAFQRQTAADLLPWPDIDVVVGHHAHVVQPIERVEGTLVVWGLGNHLANQREVPRSDGLTAVLVATKQDGGRYRVDQVLAVPTWIEPGSFRVLPIPPTLKDPNLPAALRDELIASYDRTAAVLHTTPTDGVAIAPRP
jgi:poly-gamma-glutamate synthesis protein (capsule biosynthesis protein)